LLLIQVRSLISPIKKKLKRRNQRKTNKYIEYYD
jgi:hypothetical protein